MGDKKSSELPHRAPEEAPFHGEGGIEVSPPHPLLEGEGGRRRGNTVRGSHDAKVVRIQGLYPELDYYICQMYIELKKTICVCHVIVY